MLLIYLLLCLNWLQNKTKPNKRWTMVMISQSINFSIYIVFISYMSSNVGSNIVLNSVVQLEAVLHTEGYFADTALKASLFSWPLPFASCPFQDLLLGRKADHKCPGDVGLLPNAQYFLWPPAWRWANSLAGWPLGVREGKIPEFLTSSFTSSLWKVLCLWRM